MKRLRFGEEVVLDHHMASVLMLLSSGKRNQMGLDVVDSGPVTGPPTARVFECKTCKRRFSSFQALGGHRASHKKPRGEAGGDDGLGHERPKVHGCTVCGLEFAVGQALGGHMRRHRSGWTGPVALKVQKEEKVLLDLNLLPPPSPLWGGGDDDFRAE